MSSLAHTTAPPTLRLLERRPRPSVAVTPAARRAAPSISDLVDHWLAALPEPRNRLGAATRV